MKVPPPSHSGPARRLLDIIRQRWREDHRSVEAARAKRGKLPIKYRIAEWTLVRTFAPIFLYAAVGAGIAAGLMLGSGFTRLPEGEAGRPDRAWYAIVEKHGVAPARASVEVLMTIEDLARAQLLANDAEFMRQMISAFLEQTAGKKSIMQFLNDQVASGAELKEIAKLERQTVYAEGVLRGMKKILNERVEQQNARWNTLSAEMQSSDGATKACAPNLTKLEVCLRANSPKK